MENWPSIGDLEIYMEIGDNYPTSRTFLNCNIEQAILLDAWDNLVALSTTGPCLYYLMVSLSYMGCIV